MDLVGLALFSFPFSLSFFCVVIVCKLFFYFLFYFFNLCFLFFFASFSFSFQFMFFFFPFASVSVFSSLLCRENPFFPSIFFIKDSYHTIPLRSMAAATTTTTTPTTENFLLTQLPTYLPLYLSPISPIIFTHLSILATTSYLCILYRTE